MFYFRTPVQPDEPEPRDPAEVEFWRRLLDHGPGPITKPIQTVDQIRAELAERGAVSARTLTLSEAGFGAPFHVVVVRDVDGGLERIERAETAIQPPPEGTEAEGFRPFGETDFDAENADFGIKEITWARKPAFVEKTEAYPATVRAEGQNSPSLVTGPLKPITSSDRKRRHKDDVPWHKKRFVQGHKVSKTLSMWEREWIDGAVLRWKVLMGKKEQIVCITIKPSHLDDLGPVERMEYWEPLVNRFRSYRNSRCTVLGKPHSSWEVRVVGVRESNQDHLGEHCHTAFSFPNREEADLFIAHVQDPANSDVWGDDVHAMRISTREEMVGGKLSSFFNYMLKAAHPRSTFADHTIGWQPSGALVGKRYFITTNLTDPEVIAQTEVGVATLKRVREEKKLAALRRRAQANREGQYSYARPAPAELPAIEPTPSDEADYLTHQADGPGDPVHREAERRDVPAEVPVQDDARAPGRAEVQDAAEPGAAAEVHAEAPSAPAGLRTPATPIPAAIVFPVSAEPGPLSSSRKAVLAPLAAHGRAAIPRRPRRGGYPSTGFTGIPPPPTRRRSTASARQGGTAGRARAPPWTEMCRLVRRGSRRGRHAGQHVPPRGSLSGSPRCIFSTWTTTCRDPCALFVGPPRPFRPAP